MLIRFSLYGFLKNQAYFEPFLILAFREKGLSFFQIGLLIGFRELCVNLFEVPSGAVADLYGRRRSLIFAFAAYIVSFLLFAWAADLSALFFAMFAFALGEAFRSGTHKAMIFDWLRSQDRLAERTRIYGVTRSWSKMGSALSVLIAAGFVFAGASYSQVFLLTVVPYLMGIVNFMGYPAFLDGPRREKVALRPIATHLREALRQAALHPPLRRLMAESMSFEGTYKATKDYVQPVIKQTALGLALLTGLEAGQRVAVLTGGVYFILHLLSSAASRGAHRLSRAAGSEKAAARVLWAVNALLYGLLAASLWLGWRGTVIACFVALAVAQNLWRPALISRFDAHSSAQAGATVLSIESQAQTVATMLLAPALGFAVDRLGLWPVGLAGFLLSAPFALEGLRGLRAGGLRRRGPGAAEGPAGWPLPGGRG